MPKRKRVGKNDSWLSVPLLLPDLIQICEAYCDQQVCARCRNFYPTNFDCLNCNEEATYETLDGLHSWNEQLGYRWEEYNDQEVMNYIYDFIGMWHDSSVNCRCLRLCLRSCPKISIHTKHRLTVKCLFRKTTRARGPDWQLTLSCN